MMTMPSRDHHEYEELVARVVDSLLSFYSGRRLLCINILFNWYNAV